MILIVTMVLILLGQSNAVSIFFKQPVDREVIFGKTTESFDCVLQASDVTDLSVSWIHTDLQGIKREYPVESITENKGGYQIIGKTSEGDFSLIVSNASKTDAGEFRCRVRQRNGVVDESASGRLSVFFPPDNGYPKCSSSKLQNGETRMNCVINANASPVNMNWTRLGDENPLKQVNESQEITTSILLNDNDNGMVFRCIISGKSVDSERFCDIIPMNQPPIAEFRSGSTRVKTAIGGGVALKCDGIGKPYISNMRWFYGDRHIEKTIGRFKISVDKTLFEISEMTESDHDKPVTCEASIPSGLATNITKNVNIYKLITIEPQTIAPASTKKISNESSLLILVISAVAAILILIVIIIFMCYEKNNRLSQVKTAYPLNNGLILRMQNDSPRDSLTQSIHRDSFIHEFPIVDEVTKASTLPIQPSAFQTVVCYQPGPDSPAICYPVVTTPLSAKSCQSASPYFKNVTKPKKSASFSSSKRRDSKCKPQESSAAQFSSMHSLNVYDTIPVAKKPLERTGSL